MTRTDRLRPLKLAHDASWQMKRRLEPRYLQGLATRLRDVARCPFATSAELHALTGRTFLRSIASLRERGLIQSVDYRSGVNGRVSAPHFLTREGLRVLSEWLGQPESVTLRELPVSAEWQQELLGRIEILALVYRSPFRWRGAAPRREMTAW